MSVAPASHAHTYLLDLEQLVVVARLDNTKTTTTTSPTTNSSAHDDGDDTDGVAGPVMHHDDTGTNAWSTHPFSGGQGVLGEGQRGGGNDKYSPIRRMFPPEEDERCKLLNVVYAV